MNPSFDALSLTDREIVIVWAWALGRSDDWIAAWSNASVDRVKSRAKNLRRKLSARTKTQAVAIVFRTLAEWEEDHPPERVSARVTAPSSGPEGSMRLPVASPSMRPNRLRRIRLSDIPFQKRMAAARRESVHATDEERSDLFLAAMFPSDKLYWIKAPDEEPLRAAA